MSQVNSFYKNDVNPIYNCDNCNNNCIHFTKINCENMKDYKKLCATCFKIYQSYPEHSLTAEQFLDKKNDTSKDRSLYEARERRAKGQSSWCC